MRKNRCIALLSIIVSITPIVQLQAQDKNENLSFEQYIRNSVLEKGEINVFVDPQQHSWAQYDAELGYILGNDLLPGAIDKSKYISTVRSDGARAMHMYENLPCRINTYGNSFTMCSQVSDGETWQEYLAAHLGEPVRNYGMGGYGVYQAYRRMLREEKTESSADYMLFYIWGDDHSRSLLTCRYVTFYPNWNNRGGRRFHNNFWPHLEMNLETGQFEEKENLLSTPESMYKMMDPDFMYEHTKDDMMLQMMTYLNRNIDGLDRERLQKLAGILDLPPINFTNEDQLRADIMVLRHAYAFAATEYILEKVRVFAASNEKKLLVVLFDPYKVTKSIIKDGTRYDQKIVDFLDDNHYYYFDMNVVHAEDFKSFNLSLDDYFKRYFIGHYKPAGNHFFAYSIKDKIVHWLDPKPITYRGESQNMDDFDGYLEK